MASKGSPKSYGEAVTEAQALVRAGRLNDPDEHFPYKHKQVRALLDKNPPAGPNGPNDESVHVSDHMSPQIADASRDYIAAQQAYLEDPGDATKAAYDHARDVLTLARRHHRRDRVDDDGNPRIIVNGVK